MFSRTHSIQSIQSIQDRLMLVEPSPRAEMVEPQANLVEMHGRSTSNLDPTPGPGDGGG